MELYQRRTKKSSTMILLKVILEIMKQTQCACHNPLFMWLGSKLYAVKQLVSCYIKNTAGNTKTQGFQRH